MIRPAEIGLELGSYLVSIMRAEYSVIIRDCTRITLVEMQETTNSRKLTRTFPLTTSAKLPTSKTSSKISHEPFIVIKQTRQGVLSVIL